MSEKNSLGYTENEWIGEVIEILQNVKGPSGHLVLDNLPKGMGHEAFKNGTSDPYRFVDIVLYWLDKGWVKP
jgi:hypothetical protein